MHEEKWLQIRDMIAKNYADVEEYEEDLEEKEGKGSVQGMEFTGPLGRMRLERVTKPVLLQKKTAYARRAGSVSKVTDYQYSETETLSTLKAYKYDEGADLWEEVTLNSLVST